MKKSFKISKLICFLCVFQQRNMASDPDVPISTIDQLKENNCRLNMGQNNMDFEQHKYDNDGNGMDSDEYGLVDDIFLVNELNASFPNSGGDASPFSSSDDDLVGLMKSATDERKPFESFEKQITITVPQPPPLKEDAFSIGGGLFDGKLSIQFFDVFFFIQIQSFPILYFSGN